MSLKLHCASIPMPLFQVALCLYFKVHCASVQMRLFQGGLCFHSNASFPSCIVPPFQCLYFLAPTSRFKCASISRFILSPSLSKMRRCLVKECAPISELSESKQSKWCSAHIVLCAHTLATERRLHSQGSVPVLEASS
jgi:hypothetical protein